MTDKPLSYVLPRKKVSIVAPSQNEGDTLSFNGAPVSGGAELVEPSTQPDTTTTAVPSSDDWMKDRDNFLANFNASYGLTPDLMPDQSAITDPTAPLSEGKKQGIAEGRNVPFSPEQGKQIETQFRSETAGLPLKIGMAAGKVQPPNYQTMAKENLKAEASDKANQSFVDKFEDPLGSKKRLAKAQEEGDSAVLDIPQFLDSIGADLTNLFQGGAKIATGLLGSGSQTKSQDMIYEGLKESSGSFLPATTFKASVPFFLGEYGRKAMEIPFDIAGEISGAVGEFAADKKGLVGPERDKVVMQARDAGQTLAGILAGKLAERIKASDPQSGIGKGTKFIAETALNPLKLVDEVRSLLPRMNIPSGMAGKIASGLRERFWDRTEQAVDRLTGAFSPIAKEDSVTEYGKYKDAIRNFVDTGALSNKAQELGIYPKQMSVKEVSDAFKQYAGEKNKAMLEFGDDLTTRADSLNASMNDFFDTYPHLRTEIVGKQLDSIRKSLLGGVPNDAQGKEFDTRATQEMYTKIWKQVNEAEKANEKNPTIENQNKLEGLKALQEGVIKLQMEATNLTREAIMRMNAEVAPLLEMARHVDERLQKGGEEARSEYIGKEGGLSRLLRGVHNTGLGKTVGAVTLFFHPIVAAGILAADTLVGKYIKSNNAQLREAITKLSNVQGSMKPAEVFGKILDDLQAKGIPVKNETEQALRSIPPDISPAEAIEVIDMVSNGKKAMADANELMTQERPQEPTPDNVAKPVGEKTEALRFLRRTMLSTANNMSIDKIKEITGNPELWKALKEVAKNDAKATRIIQIFESKLSPNPTKKDGLPKKAGQKAGEGS